MYERRNAKERTDKKMNPAGFIFLSVRSFAFLLSYTQYGGFLYYRYILTLKSMALHKKLNLIHIFAESYESIRLLHKAYHYALVLMS